MINREQYNPGPASRAKLEKNGEEWSLVLVRDLSHSLEKVWEAITKPDHLSAWSPFDADRNLDSVGPVKLTTVGAPNAVAIDSYVTKVEPPHLLELKWGENDTRWELKPIEQGTRLTLWAKIDRRYIAMGAAGWHICLDVMEKLLDGTPIGRIAGYDAMKSEEWQRLHKEYSEQFGVTTPGVEGGQTS